LLLRGKVYLNLNQLKNFVEGELALAKRSGLGVNY
jgi:hypothetical protein